MVESFKRALGLTPGWARVLAVAPVALLVAGCAQVGGPSITFWDIIWSMSVFFLWLIFIWMFVALFIDVVRRKDLSGWKKAGWIIFMLILPFLGILLYVAMRPATASDVWAQGGGYSDPYGYGGGGGGGGGSSSGSAVDEIARLQQLRAAGAITDAEFEQLKKNALASS